MQHKYQKPFPCYFPLNHQPSYFFPFPHSNTPCPCFLSSKYSPLQTFLSGQTVSPLKYKKKFTNKNTKYLLSVHFIIQPIPFISFPILPKVLAIPRNFIIHKFSIILAFISKIKHSLSIFLPILINTLILCIIRP